MNPGKPQLRILLSAFACDPQEGSEPGAGWDWAYHLARAGHDVTILARDEHRPRVEQGIQAAGMPNLRAEYVGIRSIPFWMPFVDVYPYYILWQMKAYLRARQLHRANPFDVVHHITYTSFRHVSYMPWLGIPFIFGPIGGGESAPMALRASMTGKSRVFEALRDLSNIVPRLNPVWRSMVINAACIVAKTNETRACLPRKARPRVQLSMENMITQTPCLAGDSRRGAPLRLFYAGRLLSWKGVHLAIRAVAQLAGDDVARFTIVGKGMEELRLKEEVRRLHVEDRVEFIPWLPRPEVQAMYSANDVLLFPSLHDSGGTVVLEALAHGRPVICLDLGGPAIAVDRHCARIVSTRNRTEDQVVDGLAQAIRELARMSEAEWEKMREAALQRARYYQPEVAVARVYDQILSARLKDSPAGSRSQ